MLFHSAVSIFALSRSLSCCHDQTRPPACITPANFSCLQASPLLHDEQRVFTEVADSLLLGRFPPQDLQRMALLALACLQPDPDQRPRMPTVVQVRGEAREVASNARFVLPTERASSGAQEQHMEIVPSIDFDREFNWIVIV